MNIIKTDLNFNMNKISQTNKPAFIVIHHAEASICTVQDIHKWHLENGWAGIGYHYFIRKNGEIYKGREDNWVGSHCLGHNTNSLGICFEGAYNVETMPQNQIDAGIELINYLKKKYNITKIYKHKDLYSTDCPGANFPFNKIISGALATIDNAKASNIKISTHLKAFQEAYNATYNANIAIDGIYGKETDRAIKNTLLRTGSQNALVGWLQCRVGTNIDYIFGPATALAVKRYQSRNGLDIDGIAGYNTIRSILNNYNW